MERRALKRIPSDVKASFFCNETDYFGTITDMSENGMYIKTDQISFPIESLMDIIIGIKTMLVASFLSTLQTVYRVCNKAYIFQLMKDYQTLRPSDSSLCLKLRLRNQYAHLFLT